MRVWLSAGPRVTTVAPWSGVGASGASAARAGRRTVASVAELHSPDYPQEWLWPRIRRQPVTQPRVTLLVNRGAETIGYVMPDLIGLESRRTAESLRGLGFR